MIIGVQKGGTTSLLNHLSKHPDVFVPEEKELGYFHDTNFFARGIRHYEKFFSRWKGEKWVGHAPANVIFYAKESAKRLYEFNPKIKLIVIFRNPIDRAYSAYWYFLRNCLESALSFDDAVKRELPNLREVGWEGKNRFYYIAHGFYYDQLQEFLAYFKKEQILMLLYDDFQKDPRKTMGDVYHFLSIPEIYPKDLSIRYNAAAIPKIKAINRLIYDDTLVKAIYKRILPEEVVYYLHINVFRKILNKNIKPFTYPPMTASTRKILKDIFSESNQKLSKLLQRDLSFWR